MGELRDIVKEVLRVSKEESLTELHYWQKLSVMGLHEATISRYLAATLLYHQTSLWSWGRKMPTVEDLDGGMLYSTKITLAKDKTK